MSSCGRVDVDIDVKEEPRARGGCLCGAVQFAIQGPLRDVIVCHCIFCRRATTHVGAYTACSVDDLKLKKGRKLRWYKSSPKAKRGFCSACGSSLFWQPEPPTHIAIAAGSLDEPTGLRIKEEICLAQKGDYY